MISHYEKKAKQLRKEKAKITEANIKKIIKVYEDSIKSISNNIESGEIGQVYARKLEQEMTKLYYQLEGITLGGAAEIGDAVLNSEINNVVVKYNDSMIKALTTIQDQAIKDVIGSRFYSDGKTLSDRLWHTVNKTGQDIDYIIAKGLAEKKSAQGLARDLMEFTKPPGDRSIDWIKENPIVAYKHMAYNALRVARTTINHIYQTQSIRYAESNPFNNGMKWETGNHGNVCPLCRDRDGQVYDFKDVPLDHPNGVCTITPHTEYTLEEISDLIKEYEETGQPKEIGEWLEGKNKPTTKPGEKVQYKSTSQAFKSVRWANIDPEYKKELDAALLEVINKYPIDSQDIKVRALKKDEYFGVFHRRFKIEKGEIVIEQQIVYSNELQKNKEISKKHHDYNYKYRGSPLYGKDKSHLATIYHEYGHALDHSYKMRENPDILEWTLDPGIAVDKVISNRGTLGKHIYDTLKGDKTHAEFKEQITEELGSYAATKTEEFMAEGLANIMVLSEDDKSDFIKAFEKELNKEYNRVFGG